MGAKASFFIKRKEAAAMAAKGKWKRWIAPEGLELIRGWARAGLTDEDMARNMRISVSTFYDWQKRFPEFSESLKINKDIADFKVENALYQKACGMIVEETVLTMTTDPITGKILKNTRTTKRHIPPDTLAAIFWLKNRQPKFWRDKQEVELSGTVGIADDLRKARERLAQRHDQ